MVTITMVTVPKIIKMCIHNLYSSLCLCNNFKLGTHVINDRENLNTSKHKTISMWVLCSTVTMVTGSQMLKLAINGINFFV